MCSECVCKQCQRDFCDLSVFAMSSGVVLEAPVWLKEAPRGSGRPCMARGHLCQ